MRTEFFFLFLSVICTTQEPRDSTFIEPFVITVASERENEILANMNLLVNKASTKDDFDHNRHVCPNGSLSSIHALCADKDGPCPAKMLSSYLILHQNVTNQMRMSKRRVHGLDPPNGRRFLVCKPLGGIGNFIAGLLSCLGIALITDRHLLLAPPPKVRPDSVSAYDEPISSLFDFPLDLSLATLGPGIDDVPFLTDPTTGTAVDTDILQVS